MVDGRWRALLVVYVQALGGLRAVSTATNAFSQRQDGKGMPLPPDDYLSHQTGDAEGFYDWVGSVCSWFEHHSKTLLERVGGS